MENELLDLSHKLLECISAGDWDTYAHLCDPTLSAFEPEARGHRVEGLSFHRYYFELERNAPSAQNSISAPHVRPLGDDAAVVTYVRLLQYVDEEGRPRTDQFEETRVWQRVGDEWKHVHFHRSSNR